MVPKMAAPGEREAEGSAEEAFLTFYTEVSRARPSPRPPKGRLVLLARFGRSQKAGAVSGFLWPGWASPFGSIACIDAGCLPVLPSPLGSSFPAPSD